MTRATTIRAFVTHTMNATTSRRGLTLVELLAVIAIIGLLVGLLMPALQSARETSRRSTCNNNLKTMALASIAHLEQMGTFPSNGWYNRNSEHGTSADKGYGDMQPGGWAFNILSFMESDSVRQMSGFSARSLAMPSAFTCPAFPSSFVRGDSGIGGQNYRISSYSGCAGTSSYESRTCPPSGGLLWDQIAALPAGQRETEWRKCYGYPFPGSGVALASNGVIAPLGRIRASHIRDGMSNTYLLGERAVQMSTDVSVRGGAAASGGGTEQENFYECFSGHVQGIYKNANLPPEPFRAGVFAGAPGTFGSRHPDTCGMAFCDGSVRNVSFSVSSTVHQGLGTRAGGEFVSPE
jgi:prepilin-type N-terminal cleavage/methylation domain-containing protein/prepilin-type processing-associated H-X9-DG protein